MTENSDASSCRQNIGHAIVLSVATEHEREVFFGKNVQNYYLENPSQSWYNGRGGF